MFVKNKIKSQTVSKLIPNIVTLMALCAGLTSIKFCFSGKWEWAVAAIVLAALFDALDGRVARFLDGSTQFGIELDSLSDFISFGVAPAILVYLWSLSSFPKLGWSVAMLYAVCLSLR
ncbi:MAG: CDP-alcohol phosphatidyltransferase family protein, partial [Pseudomonadota bacterium]|nr:CDP-alcohol phosphatidyltransferase family protein [Pseudomonadota bacterium]